MTPETKTTAQELKDKYDKDLQDLQDHCKHDGASWLPYEWAPAHRDGEALSCPTCWKILDRRGTIQYFTITQSP